MRDRLLIFCLAGSAMAAEIPVAVKDCAAKAGAGYQVSARVAPSYFAGDFDGDGKPDYAVLVIRTQAQGVAICLGSSAKPVVLGAGLAFNDMKDLNFTSWQVHGRKRRVGRSAGSRSVPSLLGDALLLEWESASAIVYWNGRRFIWYQQGD